MKTIIALAVDFIMSLVDFAIAVKEALKTNDEQIRFIQEQKQK